MDRRPTGETGRICNETFKAVILARADKKQDPLRIQFLRSYVRLKLNKKEKRHSDLLAAIDETVGHVNLVMRDEIEGRDTTQTIKKYENAVFKLCELADDILKEEWSRVKNEIRT
jgi:hypothetical protein